jgi:DNA-directed RNA polymerase specialized sigma24 family protein
MDRALCAADFLTHNLTSKERMLVAVLTLGFTMTEAASAFGVTLSAISHMAKRIRNKAASYWA